MNKLYYGDCLTIMEREMKLNSVDLIYLDPPFNSNRAYNAIYKDETGRPLPDQIEAFCDLWTLDSEREKALKGLPNLMIEHGVDDSFIKFWKVWIGTLRDRDPKLVAYLSYMVERLFQMKLILKPTGSIYLHCDSTYSHYLKVVMDGIFGQENYRNEVIWGYRTGGVSKKYWPRKHDTILFYVKSNAYKHNPPKERIYYDKPFFSPKKDEEGRYYADVFIRDVWDDIRAVIFDKKDVEGNYDDDFIRNVCDDIKALISSKKDAEGNYDDDFIRDIWADIKAVINVSSERLGYPTQKPVELLKRIIEASSNEDDVIFDPFCGCGTTIEAAHDLNRRWIGIDIAIHAIKRVSAVRLNERCGLILDRDYEITGVPRTLEGAEDLWKRDRYQFQKWAVEEVDGFVTARKTVDGGVDGRLYYPADDADDLKAMKLEVKGGKNVGIKDLRALAGIIDTEDYPMGGFITLKTLGRIQKLNFLDFCRTKGEVEIGGQSYPRLQILSVEEILKGDRFITPAVRGKAASDQLKIELPPQ
ncbi:MAG: DNA methyltransferase [Candidatus Poribacteria bacterium]|nr:DNA methyltransferase [Candidatus Poribacteria bacterium]